MAGTTVELNDLSDHDLLITIAKQTECIPDMEKRLRAVEQKIVALETKGGVVAIVATAFATFVGSLLPWGNP